MLLLVILKKCLWLLNESKKVKEKREQSSDKGINRLAETPYLFENNQPNDKFLAIPVVSSETRPYIPMDF